MTLCAGQAEGSGGLILTGQGIGARSLGFPGSPSNAKAHGAEVRTGRAPVYPDPIQALHVVQAENPVHLCPSDVVV